MPQANALVPQPLLNGLIYAALIVTGLTIVPPVFLVTFTNLLAVDSRKPLRQAVFGYTTAVGDQFEFALTEQHPAGWSVHILGQPSYGTRDSTMNTTHRLWGAAGEYQVCWTRRLRTPQDAHKVAVLWAEATSSYLTVGRFTAPENCPDHEPAPGSGLAELLVA